MGGGYSKGRYETESWSEGIKEFVRGGLQFYNLTSYVFQVSSSKLNISTMSVNSLPLASGYAQKLMGKFLSLQGLQERRDRVHGERGQPRRPGGRDAAVPRRRRRREWRAGPSRRHDLLRPDGALRRETGNT